MMKAVRTVTADDGTMLALEQGIIFDATRFHPVFITEYRTQYAELMDQWSAVEAAVKRWTRIADKRTVKVICKSVMPLIDELQRTC